MKNVHDTAPDELELPHQTNLIEQVCDRRSYHPPLFAALMADRVMAATVDSKKAKGAVRMRFLFGDRVAQECTVDTNSTVTIDAKSRSEWVWAGPKEGGACLIVDRAVELLEVIALDPRLFNQLGLVIAVVPLGEIPDLISDLVIQDTLLMGTSCYGAVAANIYIKAKINRVKLFAASPDPYPDWVALRDAHVTGYDPLVGRAIRGLRKTVSHLIALHLRTGRIGGIKISLPR
jgi:hypothetical protein